jgi:hypothetical protein
MFFVKNLNFSKLINGSCVVDIDCNNGDGKLREFCEEIENNGVVGVEGSPDSECVEIVVGVEGGCGNDLFRKYVGFPSIINVKSLRNIAIIIIR